MWEWKNFPEFTWICLNLLEFTWIYLNLLEFTWISKFEKNDLRTDGRAKPFIVTHLKTETLPNSWLSCSIHPKVCWDQYKVQGRTGRRVKTNMTGLVEECSPNWRFYLQRAHRNIHIAILGKTNVLIDLENFMTIGLKILNSRSKVFGSWILKKVFVPRFWILQRLLKYILSNNFRLQISIKISLKT